MDIGILREYVEEWDNIQCEIDDLESEQSDLDTEDENYDEEYDQFQSHMDSKEQDQTIVNDKMKAHESIDIDDAREWVEAADMSHLKEEVFQAAYELDVQPETVEEAYAGTSDSDEEFAQNYANMMGCVDANMTWPHDCIDWEEAAKDLMQGYMEEGQHYFRYL